MPYRALVIDDDEMNRELIETMLERLQIEAELAGNGAEGIARLARGGIDLVVVDLKLTDMSGEEVIQRIRAGAAGSEMRILAVSGLSGSGELSRQAGGDAFLAKPFTFGAFRTAVLELIGSGPDEA